MSTAPRFDWRSQFAALEPFLRGEGGVVHVHAAPGAAAQCFVRAVEHLSAGPDRPVPRATVVLDLNVTRTELAATVVEAIEYAMPSTVSVRERDLSGVRSAPLTLSVAERARVGGDVRIHLDGPVGNPAADPAHRPFHEADLVEGLRRKLLAELPQHRLTLLLTSENAPSDAVTYFAARIWDRALSECVGTGLLLVDVFNPHVGVQRGWPPPPTIPPLTLPTAFDRDDRDHARADLARQAVANRWYADQERAGVFADTVLDTSRDVDQVYAAYGNMLAKHPVRQP